MVIVDMKTYSILLAFLERFEDVYTLDCGDRL